MLDRVLGRERGERRPLPAELDADSFVDRGDDVWKALRY
jgi:hypothetical protein